MRTGWLLVVAVVVASACGAPPSAAAPASALALVAAERLVVEGDDVTRVLETGLGRTYATLPAGVLSPAAAGLIVSLGADGTSTHVRGSYVPYLTGQVDPRLLSVLDLTIPGAYQLPTAYGAAPSGFSPNGKWLVLVSRDASESRFAIIDVDRSTLATTVALGSRFTFDAIHNDGSAMYLIEHPVAGSTSYNVRFYDVASRTLKPDIIFDKAAIAQFDPTVGLMDGTFHVSLAPRSGDWSYGLYMRPNGSPFVHALNVPGHFAQCIVDVAGTWTADSMFSMAITDDGRRLYVVDGAAGALTVIDGDTHAVLRRTTFATRGGTGGDPRAASAVLSRDGTRLYATAPRGIAILQTTDLTLRGWAAPDLSARSLALSSDGARLYALGVDAISVIDASTGRVLSQLQVTSGARAIHVLGRDPASRR